jgi:EF-1 guanine nucleotide exchange domain
MLADGSTTLLPSLRKSAVRMCLFSFYNSTHLDVAHFIHSSTFPHRTNSFRTATAPTSTTTEEKKEEDIDLFGDDEDDEEYERQLLERRKAAEELKGKKNKPAVVAKSSLLLDVKPWDDETPMDKLEESVRAIEMEGLVWGACKCES